MAWHTDREQLSVTGAISLDNGFAKSEADPEILVDMIKIETIQDSDPAHLGSYPTSCPFSLSVRP
jgi:hypothetical protein